MPGNLIDRKILFSRSKVRNKHGTAFVGIGVGVSFFFSKFFLFQFLSLFSCNVIFECLASFLELW